MTLTINMALLTVQRSPSSTDTQLTEPDGATVSAEETSQDVTQQQNRQRSISECYIAMKGAAIVLPQNECINRKASTAGVNTISRDIQQHLQSMFLLLRPEDTLKMAVKLESVHVDRTRYLVVVSCTNIQNLEESCLLGVDCNVINTSLGLVLPVWADVKITLDGDGGFSVTSNSRHHIFKPVSVQAMWSALQTLHKASDKATKGNYFLGGGSHSWIDYYEKTINSDRSCLNEWHAMDDLESRRPPSPDYRKSHPRDREVTERRIRSKLREVMMTVDLDEVTSKHIRTSLEKDLEIDLQEYKSFIDEEMLTIMGQMDTSTEIFDHLFLGSEWNASNLEELQRNGVGHILNVTREIDNFFPGMFEYLNIRVYDEEGTELLKHWDKTYRFITEAKEKGSKVLVHCKMGVSRSASVVIAYIMKSNNWKLHTAFDFVKEKRNCVQPNQSFMKQLETYQGILDASNHRHNTLWRSKSENNLKKREDETNNVSSTNKDEKQNEEQTSSLVPELYLETQSSSCHRPKSWSPDENIADMLFPENVSTTDSSNMMTKNHVLLRPACLVGLSYSVSPNKALHLPLPSAQQQQQQHSSSSSQLIQIQKTPQEEPEDKEVDKEYHHNHEPIHFAIGTDDSPTEEQQQQQLNNRQSSTIDETTNNSESNNNSINSNNNSGRLVKRVASIKDRINELESQAQQSNEIKQGLNRDWLDLPENTGLVLNLANQFESVSKSTPNSPVDELDIKSESFVVPSSDVFETGNNHVIQDVEIQGKVLSQTKQPATKLQAVLVKPENWNCEKSVEILRTSSETQLISTLNNDDVNRRHSANEIQSENDVFIRLRVNNQSKDLNKTFNDCSNTGTGTNDVFSTNLDRIFDKEELSNSQKNDLKIDESVLCDIKRQKSFRNSLRTNSVSQNDVGTDENSSSVPETTSTVDCDECLLLKRATSLDGSLPNLRGNQQNNIRHCQGHEGPLNEGPMTSVIQRSQSLRSAKHQEDKVLRIHGPKPYKSPSDKQISMCILDGATIMASTRPYDVTGAILHYASAPILCKESSNDYQTVPKSFSSQPNITFSPLNVSKLPGIKVPAFKESSAVESGENFCSENKDKSKIDEKGIVKQHKEVLESKIAMLKSVGVDESSVLELPVTNNVEKAEEWRILQCKLQLMSEGQIDDCQPPGKVKRMTRQMELATTTTGTGTLTGTSTYIQPSTTGILTSSELIILDLNGKEISTPQINSLDSQMPIEMTSQALCSPVEDNKSVKSLVGKFEVKVKPTRQRYYSETEVENLSWSVADSDKMALSGPMSPIEQQQCRKRLGTELDVDLKIKIEPAVVVVDSNETLMKSCGAKREKWASNNSSWNHSLPPMSMSRSRDDGHLITSSSECGIPHRKVRKAQGKTHPLSKLQNGVGGRLGLGSQFYSTM
ncbi:hypothetical protein CHUAL_005985 [Chamberlinius hualienensis]